MAIYKIAQKYDVTESTIRDAYTRRLKLNTEDFKILTKYPEDLMRVLKKDFQREFKK